MRIKEFDRGFDAGYTKGRDDGYDSGYQHGDRDAAQRERQLFVRTFCKSLNACETPEDVKVAANALADRCRSEGLRLCLVALGVSSWLIENVDRSRDYLERVSLVKFATLCSAKEQARLDTLKKDAGEIEVRAIRAETRAALAEGALQEALNRVCGLETTLGTPDVHRES